MMKKLKLKLKGGERDDRISALPDFILHRILSILEPEAAARAAVLSKYWLTVWQTYPNLTFNFRFLRKQHQYSDVLKEERRRKFIKFAENTISRFSQAQLLVNKVRIMMYRFDDPIFDSLMDKLIRFLLEKDVKVLDFDCSGKDMSWSSMPAEVIFAAKSWIELKLRSCSFDNMINVSGTTETDQFNKLKKVAFSRVALHDWVVDKLISNCPLIEDIELSVCRLSFETLRVSNVPNLKKFAIQYCRVVGNANKQLMVEMNAPSLESFEYRSTATATEGLLNLDVCKNLKELRLCTTNKLFESLSMSKFPFLEDLELKLRSVITSQEVNITSRSLKQVHMHNYNKMEKVTIDAPNLLVFNYRSTHEISTPISLTKAPKQFIAKFLWVHITTSFLKYLRELLKNFSNETKVSLSMDVHHLSSLISETNDLKELLKPAEVENLTLCLYRLRSADCRPLLDGVFSICHPTYMSVIWNDPKLKECLWENLMNRAAGNLVECCNHRKIKCWRHYLEDAKVKRFNGKHGAYESLGEAMKIDQKDGAIIRFKFKWGALCTDVVILHMLLTCMVVDLSANQMDASLDSILSFMTFSS